jgi:hypothetical protein
MVGKTLLEFWKILNLNKSLSKMKFCNIQLILKK